jgi:hypothetical protein
MVLKIESEIEDIADLTHKEIVQFYYKVDKRFNK